MYYRLWRDIALTADIRRLFFNILHPPLNVPALGQYTLHRKWGNQRLTWFLAVSLDHDVNTDKELLAHGYSNLLAGLFGTV